MILYQFDSKSQSIVSAQYKQELISVSVIQIYPPTTQGKNIDWIRGQILLTLRMLSYIYNWFTFAFNLL